VKRLSLVRCNPQADRVEYLEGNSKLPRKARGLETAAGSESTACSEMEVSRDLGDPPWSWEAQVTRVCRLNGPSIGEQTLRWKSDSPTVLGTRESRVQGEEARQSETGYGTHRLYAQ
jgi:hypothetical protein